MLKNKKMKKNAYVYNLCLQVLHVEPLTIPQWKRKKSPSVSCSQSVVSHAYLESQTKIWS